MNVYREGDLVVIKDWDEMAGEFGFMDSEERYIDCHPAFVPEMRRLCGELAYITKISKYSTKVSLDFLNKELNVLTWNYSLKMIKLYDGAYDEYDLDESLLVEFVKG